MIKFFIMFNMVIFTPETVPEDVGTYPVEVEYSEDGNEVSEVINLTIISENTVVEQELAINANDFVISDETFLSDELIIKLSNAKAWNMSTLDEYEIESVGLAKVDDYHYQATLYSFQEISITINITVEEEFYETLILSDSGVTKNKLDLFSNIYQLSLIVFLLIILVLAIIIITLIVQYNKLIKKGINNVNISKESVKKS